MVRSLTFILLVLFSFFLLGCGSSGSDDSSEDSNSSENRPTISEPYSGAGLFALDNPQYDLDQAKELVMTPANPGFSFIPGVFGSRIQNYYNFVDSLLEEDIKPQIRLYALCGPCRPPRRDGSLVQFRPDLNIDELNRGLAESPEIQSQYADYVFNNIKPLVDAYPQLNFIIVPELEDNMTDEAFEAAIDLTVTVMAENENVRFQRNPLSNRSKRTYGPHTVGLEVHTTNLGVLDILQPDDTISLDGQNFRFRGEDKGCNPPAELEFEDLRFFMQAALDRDINFELWRHEWQGLPLCGGPAQSPENRTYVFTFVDQLIELLSLIPNNN